MAQDIVNPNQNISYTNLDFASIYTEVLELIKKLTYQWDPSISDESDPGVILVKLSALIADKCNYNIDKSILEAFPLSVTQDGNARQLYEQLGYYMDWYESASTPVALNWIKQESDSTDILSYTIPKFTIISDADSKIKYALVGVYGSSDNIVVSDGIITTDSKEIKMVAMEGTPVKYSYLNGETVITSQMVDKETNRLYFEGNLISQNGIFITNTGQQNYASWTRVDNLYEQAYNELRYIFGFDTSSNTCYLEFPDNYAELFGDGIEITYLVIDSDFTDVPAQFLTKFYVDITPKEDSTVTLNSANVNVTNYAAASGHLDKESINDAYKNYKKIVGTFNTLITLRDYLNYIRSKDLDICSNAFVCDRTNDIQSTYKIVSKQNNLDSIVVKVEQIVDKNSLESNFNYTFIKSNDASSIAGKQYYTIVNDILNEVQDSTGGTPKASGWYEIESRVAKTYDALEPFSLKFYMLKTAIALDSKANFDETFGMSTENLDLDTILANTAHLEHTYEDLLPLGQNSYKVTTDQVFLANKSYYTKNTAGNYVLYTNYSVGDSITSAVSTYYEIDIEALLPHIVLLKNVYPIFLNIATYDSLNSETQSIVLTNILTALYENLNSTKLEFGESINIEYLTNIVRNCDDRIKDVTFDSITYSTKATYYDSIAEEYKTVAIPSNMAELTGNQFDEADIIGKFIGRDITSKSILAGVSSLLSADDVFTYHLNHKFIYYYDGIRSITSQAVIDIGGEDATTTYSSSSSTPYIRQSYELKQNEVLSLYRPKLTDLREFLSGIHYEYLIYNDIKAGQSYELQQGEYIIFYQSYYASDSTSSVPDGFSVFACAAGIIISPTQDLAAQTDSGSWTNYAKAAVLPAFDIEDASNWYETSTYSSNYTTEIYNNSSIIANAISGTDSIKIQSLSSVEISTSDNYKFFWVLNTPDYSNDNQIKTYTLFPEYDVDTERESEFEKNSYTLKSGEWLYYVDSSNSDLAILGAGTTIYRNCGVDVTEYNDDDAHVAFSYTNIEDFESGSGEARFEDGILEKITSYNEQEGYVINPSLNGWFTRSGSGTVQSPYVYTRTTDTAVQASTDYYVITMDNNAGLYKRTGTEGDYHYSQTTQTSDVFSEVDTSGVTGNKNPSSEGYYEIVSVNSSGVQDYYAVSESVGYDNHYRYSTTTDTSMLSRFIFDSADYSDIEIDDVTTYKDISITSSNASDFDYVRQKLLLVNGDSSYKAYYSDASGTRITDIELVDDPSGNSYNHTGSPWYELVNGSYVITTDTHPVILSDDDVLSYPETLSDTYCFEEVPFFSSTTGSWPAINFNNKGYFYKANSTSSTYTWEPSKTSVSLQVSSSMLSALLVIYKEALSKYPGDTSEAATNLINYIITNWNTGVSYNHPFRTSSKSGWRTPTFRELETGETATHFAISRTTYINKLASISNATKYPRYSLNNMSNNCDVILSVDYIDAFTESEIVANLISTGSYIEVLTTVNTSYPALKAYLAYLYETFNGNLPSMFGMEFAPKIFKFKNLIKLSTKSYYLPNTYVEKTFSTIDAWTCTALDADAVAKDPITVIENNWQAIQTNTSIKVTQNEIWSFAEGDIVRFEAPVMSQKAVVWPVFTNKETILDLDSYSISYQRNGSSIEELSKLDISGYEWQGYSHLLLNTSSSEGQMLESNQSILLYSLGDSGVLSLEATINGSDYNGVTFQLKYPVSNVSGRFIDVTTKDIYGTTQENVVYEFVPLVNGSKYKYTSDYETYVQFDVNATTHKIIDSQVSLPLYVPNGKYLLPVYCPTEGVRYKVSKYIQAKKVGTSFTYCLNSSPIPYTGTDRDVRITINSDTGGAYGEHLFTYNADNTISTANNEYYINDTKHYYLSFDIDTDPFDSESYVPVKLPAYLTEYYSDYLTTTASPSWFGWYEKNSSGEYVASINTSIGTSLLEAVSIPSYTTDIESYSKWKELNNPAENHWYERNGTSGSYYYTLTSDTTPAWGKTYYKDKEFYAPYSVVEAPILKVDADNPYIDIEKSYINIIFGDVFKYENNSSLGDDFYKIKKKIKALDVDTEYNYTYVPNSNDLISDPLDPKTYFNINHPFNKYVIAQLDFDNLEYRFIT